MIVAALIGLMIAVVVGINLIPRIIEVVPNMTGNTTDLSPGISGSVKALPYIFVAVIILGAVAWMGTNFFGGDKDEPKLSWGSLGRDLKKAYTEKFGRNKEFEREVGKRVKCMRSGMEEGEKAACRQWLKSTASLVGVPWPIPDEEKNGKYSTWE